jgi:F-type H+-transporting ATPase subunit gamma
MAALREIKERIGSVGSTLKTTSAMKMVASAKFHRVQGGSQALVAYEKSLRETLRVLCADTSVQLHSPYIEPRESCSRAIVVALSSDTSLCGAFNSQIIRAAQATVASLKQGGVESVSVWPIGEKMAQAAAKWGCEVCNDYRNISSQLSSNAAAVIAQRLMEEYESGKADKICIVYNHFHSMARQEPTEVLFLPFDISTMKGGDSAAAVVAEDYICEPTKGEIFAALMPYMLRCRMYALLLDSSTAEFAARTVAMQTATDNAQDLLDELKLGYNKQRQQAITAELADIAQGE